jgi:lipopolysaccharide export system protein LptC
MKAGYLVEKFEVRRWEAIVLLLAVLSLLAWQVWDNRESSARETMIEQNRAIIEQNKARIEQLEQRLGAR